VKGSFQVVNISPDGQTLAFTVIGDTSGRIFLRKLSELTPHVLPGSDRAYDLFFSPDGKSIGFFTIDGILRKVGVDGTNLVTLGNTPSFYSGGAWGVNQQIIIGQQGDSRDLLQTTVGGGSIKPLTTGAKVALARPFFTPDGKAVLYVEWGLGFTEDDYFGIADPTSGKFTTSKVLIAAVLGVVDGHAIVVTADGAIKALPFDARSQRVTGDAIQIEEPGTTLTQASTGTVGTAAMSTSGTLVYLRGTNDGRLMLSDSTDSRPLGAERRGFGNAVFSPDGRRIAVAVQSQRGDTAVSDIFFFDLNTRTLNRLTSRGDAVSPKWTADGKSVVFATWFGTKPSVWRQPIDGTAAERLVVPNLKGNTYAVILAVSPAPDGRGLVFGWNASGNAVYDLYYVSPTGDREPRKLETGSRLSIDPAISPDGHWLAFSGGDDFVRTNIFVMPLDGAGTRIQVSTDGGDLPRWSRDGSHLYYRHSGAIAMATIKRSAGAIEVVGKPVAVFPKLQRLTDYDIAPDEKHALTVKRDATDLRMVVVTDWVARVRSRIAEARGGK
jgi:Tol biopolymer transport system component